MSSEVFERFFKDSSEGLALINEKGIIEKANSTFCGIFDYDPSEVEGHKMDFLLPEDVRSNHDNHRKHFMKQPEKRPMGRNRDLFGRKKDGTKVPLEISLSPISMANGERKVAVLLSDISDRKKSQEAIKELNEQLNQKVLFKTKELLASQTLYEEISRNFPNGTINVFDKDLSYIFVEGEELRKLGVEAKHLNGTSYLDRLPEHIRSTMAEKLTEVFAGKSAKFELELNSEIYQIIGAPLPEENGSIARILVVERNITDESNAKKEIENALHKERHLNELKSRFVSMVSHEFRTPLTAINSSSSLISRYVDNGSADKVDRHTQKIQGNVQHLISMLDDILSLSRLEDGRISITLEDIHLKDFLDEIMEEIELFAEGKVSFQLKTNHLGILKTDPRLLKGILMNLLSNAVKYSFPEGVVTLEVQDLKDYLVFAVSDNGLGIPEEEQENIYSRFFRASNVSNIEGTGLGLSIVTRFLDQLEGSISFKSIPKEITTFKVSIPNTHE